MNMYTKYQQIKSALKLTEDDCKRYQPKHERGNYCPLCKFKYLKGNIRLEFFFGINKMVCTKCGYTESVL